MQERCLSKKKKNVGKDTKSNSKCSNADINETGEILCGGEGRTLRARVFTGGEECYVPKLFELVLDKKWWRKLLD